MAEQSTASSKTTRSAGKHTKNAPTLALKDEVEILESQAADVAKAAGVQFSWAVLSPGGELVLVLEGASLCPIHNRPYWGEKCWHCETEQE